MKVRWWLALGTITVVVAAGAAFALWRFLPRASDGGAYAQPDELCAAIDPSPLGDLSLHERTGAGRSTDKDDVYEPPVRTCSIDLQPNGRLRVTAVVFGDAERARRRYEVEQRCETPSEVPNLGARACFGTSTATITDASGSTPSVDYTVEVLDRNLGLTVRLGDDVGARWHPDTVKVALVAVARHVLDTLPKGASRGRARARTVCDALDPSPLRAVRLIEAGQHRTERESTFKEIRTHTCELTLKMQDRPEPDNSVIFAIDTAVFPDAAAAENDYGDLRSYHDEHPQEVAGVGDRAFMNVDTNGLLDVRLVTQRGTRSLTVRLQAMRDTNWEEGALRTALATIARKALDALG